MKFILIILLFITLDKCLCWEDYEYLATALFYTDQNSRMLLVTGPLLEAAEVLIRQDLIGTGSLDPNIPLRIVPVYQNAEAVPARKDILITIRKKYPSLHVASISKENSTSVLENMRRNWNSLLMNKLKTKREHIAKNQSKISKSLSAKGIMQAPKDYVPNDLYYAVEKRCANWASGCDQKSLSILDLPSHVFKPPYQFAPHQVNWFP